MSAPAAPKVPESVPSTTVDAAGTVAGTRAVGFGPVFKAYLALTKPRVIELLLVCTLPTLFLAVRGLPDPWITLWTLVGGALSAGSAEAFNSYIDRDMDAVMHRTRNRPLVTGAVSPRAAWIFATALAVVSTAIFLVFTTWLAAALSVAAIFLYVVFYTLILKRRTSQNIVWGGVAGCMPVLIAWAAATGRVDPPAWVLFAIIFLWTPAHYWPLSMKYREDYAKVGVPMLSVVRGESMVSLQVILYAWATVACSLLLIPVGDMGVVYTIVALAAGIWFLVEAHRLYSGSIRAREVKPMRVFHGSISYLTLLFVAVGVDPLLPPMLHF